MARGLGKGINALFTDFNAKEDEQFLEVKVKDCRPNPYQPRKQFSEEAIEELSQSIQEHGILQPLIVRKSIKGYEIVAGERRYRAAKAADLEKVPVIVKDMTDEQMMEVALLENLQRENLTPIEEAKAYQSLISTLEVTQDVLAKRLGKSRSHIANSVRLLGLAPEIIEKINEGVLSMGHGRALLGLKDQSKSAAVIERIESERLNVRQTEKLIAELNERKAKKKTRRPEKDIFIKEREDTLRERLGTDVTIHKGKKKGKIEIEFFDNDDLERILNWLDHK
ncbi:ParB/RepB/Spo0J family partition protein [Halobacillus sp. A5]|uniref:ParB/RepB/Spo0J family partition protein n=1 Tax=Halobacillus sp. A5 TaxID=2880263 RepID=UPI0020A6D326|nr:ParB/RepB/Spo0J family partition protein [Halobacillus sp. A5]MCP3026969.1 ParB/RepB/Spo0J family partition protein [Halobacillus sp. A5]